MGEGEGSQATLSRRRLLKLAGYGVPAMTLVDVATASRVLAVTPPPCVPPAAPAGLAAATGGVSNTVDLSWEASLGAISYNVYRESPDGPALIATGLSGTSYSVTGLTNGIEYCFAVSASNACGESARSAPACATPWRIGVLNSQRWDIGNDRGWGTWSGYDVPNHAPPPAPPWYPEGDSTFAARWEGYLRVPAPGIYWLRILGKDGVRDAASGHVQTSLGSKIPFGVPGKDFKFNAGEAVKIELTFIHLNNLDLESWVVFEWKTPGSDVWVPVPPEALGVPS